jgi:hypothetical protein
VGGHGLPGRRLGDRREPVQIVVCAGGGHNVRRAVVRRQCMDETGVRQIGVGEGGPARNSPSPMSRRATKSAETLDNTKELCPLR